MTTQTLSFRPIDEQQDRAFLEGLYGSTRAEELAMVDWTQEQADQFIKMQFHAQHTFYMEQFADAAFDLVLLDDKPIGRLYLDRRQDEFRIIDIALLPEYRGRGLGHKLLQDILDEAFALHLPVRIHVEHNNPAMRLYHRLGFKKQGDTGVYFLMEAAP